MNDDDEKYAELAMEVDDTKPSNSSKSEPFRSDQKSQLTDRIVNTSRSSNRVWLVKLPDFLMQYWSKAEPSSTLGTLSIGDKDPKTGIPKVSIRVAKPLLMKINSEIDDDNQNEGSGKNIKQEIEFPAELIPVNYDIKFTSNPPGNMLVFTEDSNSMAKGIEGTVQHECHATPIMNEEYRNIMRYRRSQASKPSRSTRALSDESKPIEDRTRKRMVIPTTDSYLMTAQPALAPTKKRKAEDIRRDRLPREEALSLVFKAFESQEFWTAAALIKHLNQPTAFIKELLNEVAVYLPGGPHRNHYQLKPEFRPQVEQEVPEQNSGST